MLRRYEWAQIWSHCFFMDTRSVDFTKAAAVTCLASPRRGWQISLQVPALSLECQALDVEQVPRSRSVGSRSSGRPGQTDQPGCFSPVTCLLYRSAPYALPCACMSVSHPSSALTQPQFAANAHQDAVRCVLCPNAGAMRSLGVTWQRSPLVSSLQLAHPYASVTFYSPTSVF